MDSCHMRFYYTAQSILLDRIFALQNIIEPLLFIYLYFFGRLNHYCLRTIKKVKESMHQSQAKLAKKYFFFFFLSFWTKTWLLWCLFEIWTHSKSFLWKKFLNVKIVFLKDTFWSKFLYFSKSSFLKTTSDQNLIRKCLSKRHFSCLKVSFTKMILNESIFQINITRVMFGPKTLKKCILSNFGLTSPLFDVMSISK